MTIITAHRISDYMTEAVNTDSIADAEIIRGSGLCMPVHR
ncbi:hypothetical protein [Escherichia coli]